MCPRGRRNISVLIAMSLKSAPTSIGNTSTTVLHFIDEPSQMRRTRGRSTQRETTNQPRSVMLLRVLSMSIDIGKRQRQPQQSTTTTTTTVMATVMVGVGLAVLFVVRAVQIESRV